MVSISTPAGKENIFIKLKLIYFNHNIQQYTVQIDKLKL